MTFSFKQDKCFIVSTYLLLFFRLFNSKDENAVSKTFFNSFLSLNSILQRNLFSFSFQVAARFHDLEVVVKSQQEGFDRIEDFVGTAVVQVSDGQGQLRGAENAARRNRKVGKRSIDRFFKNLLR